jgi:signal transduction histidine kinase
MHRAQRTTQSGHGDDGTFFAPAQRAEKRDLLRNIDFVSRNPVIDLVLRSAGSLLAILNEQRQIVAVNDALLKVLGLDNASDVFGLRPGEAIHCTHARDMPGGCGTSRYCETCGAAIAIVTALCGDEPVERDCAVTAERNGRKEDLFFRVRAQTLAADGHRLILLFLQDMTEAHQRALLERVFLHDISNLVSGLVGSAELLDPGQDRRHAKHAGLMLQLSRRLAKEIQVQKAIMNADPSAVTLSLEEVSAQGIGSELTQVFAHHPAAKGRRVDVETAAPDVKLTTDASLLVRMLANAVTNALEATAEGNTVRVWHEPVAGGARFCVWNREAIPAPAALRVFQRCFTTKRGPGRGFGTYIMKLLGEDRLKGKVDFTTSPADGTVFRIQVPSLAQAGNPAPGQHG